LSATHAGPPSSAKDPETLTLQVGALARTGQVLLKFRLHLGSPSFDDHANIGRKLSGGIDQHRVNTEIPGPVGDLADAIGDTAEQKIADLKAQIDANRGPLDLARTRLRERRDTYGRTSIHIQRSALEFCVRTVSHTPRNPGATP